MSIISRDNARAAAMMQQMRGMRRGQALFNSLSAEAPQLAAALTESPSDPFYEDSREGAFWAWLAELETECDS